MFTLFANKNIRYFCLTVSLLALLSGALRTAIPLLARQSGYGVVGVSWAQGLFSLAWPIFGILAGALLDRCDKIKLATSALLIFMLLHIVLFVLLMIQIAPAEQIFFYATIAGFIVVSAEAYIMTIPPLIMEGERLMTFYSIVLFLDFGVSYFLAPVITSSILAHSTLLFLGLLIVLFITLIFTARRAVPTSPTPDKENITFRYIIAGFRFIFSNRHLTSLTLLTFFLSVVFGAFLTSFIFFVTDGRYLGLHSSQYGVMFAAYALGTMAGALFAPRIRYAPVRLAVLTDGLGTVILLLVPAFSKSAVVVWGVTFIAGVGASLWFIGVTAFRQRLTPKQLLGRANSAFRVIGYAGMPVGSFLVGVLGSFISLQFAAAFIAGLLLVAIAITLPFLWQADHIDTPNPATR
ncbi:MFS transporter [Bartonella grahamii]|uniref:Enterobactin exporter EntS n=1 Tax=Bartonella grahamii TaxID=33045 RepID=A0A336NDD1_BARGR|nr:MFS transporter [Bartonella grahamii]SSZ40232.1 enterobactin exporter EntS [Bartonella grahamii]